MRTFLLFFAVLTFAAAPTEAANRNFGVNGFDRIRVDGPYKVRVTTGVAPFATATGSAIALDAVAIDVQGRTLVVRSSRSSWGGYPGEAKGPVEIRIGTHELTAAYLNGAGSLAVDKVRGLTFDLSVQGSGSAAIGTVAVDQFRLNMGGSGTTSLAGDAPRLTATVRGMSTLDSSGLNVKDATLGADGPATIRVTVTGTAKVDAQGTATVELAGEPVCTVRAVGSASVSGCR